MYKEERITLKVKWYNHNYLTQSFLYKSLYKAKKYARGKLLDVGCGQKPYENFFSDSISEYIGIDLPQSVSANKLPKRADIYYDINKGLPFESDSFDTVLCTEVLEHVQEPSYLIKEINRVLKKGGYLILSAPQCWGLHEEPCDYYRYTKYGLKYLVEKNGFELKSLEERGGLWVMVGQRMCSFIHYNYVDGRNIFMKLFFKMIYILLSQICLFLDRVYKHKGDTLGITIISMKRKEVIDEYIKNSV